MGQENEEKAELLATIQHDHAVMKKWYNSNSDAKILHTIYGPGYPDFWRDVIDWKGWKESRKRYLKSIGGHLSSARAAASKSGTETGSPEIVPRKRKSRWATANNASGSSSDPPKRKSRWARGRDPTPAPAPANSVLDLLPGLPSKLSAAQSQELSNLQKTLRECNAKLSNLEVEAAKIDALPIGHRDRSSSPPPVYGPDGKRRNTRAVRWRERFGGLRQDTLEKILKLTTGGNAAASVAPSLFNRKRTRKIYIPVEDHPTYNFIGLIIGPRGKTQKEMEGKTGCKIAIRGKGSVKEGARGRRDGKIMEGDNEPLHVVVSGASQENVDKAAQMIEDMLVVIDDDKNIHKQAQLRELALLNGTLKEDEYCTLCAEKGHRAFECPKRFSMNKPGLELKCAICGDTSHPTRDCKQKASVTAQEDTKQLDSDYLAFMNELDGKPADAKSSEVKGPLVQSLVTSIGPDGKPIGGAPMCKIVPAIEKKVVSPAQKPQTGGSLITTISSRVVKSSEVDPVVTQILTGNAADSASPAAPVAPGLTAASTVSLHPSTPAAPPPPSFAGGTMSGGAAFPPPPPPPQQPVTQQYQPYQQQHQQQQQYGYGGYQQGAQGYNSQGYQGQGHHNQQYYGNNGQTNGAGSGGWDYRSFYGDGNGNSNGQGSGAGGFNWWEAS